MKTKDKQISNRNKIAALASTARFRALPPCVPASSTVGPPVQPPSFRTSSLSRRTFLIAKRKIRNCPNSRLFNTLDFSNREKSHFHRFAATGLFLASLPPCILASLIYTPKIRNRRKPRRISHLHFSNLYRSPVLFSRFCDSAPPLRWTPPFLSLLRCLLASSSRATNAGPGISRPTNCEPGAKLLRTLIYGTGIKFSRKSLKTKGRDRA